MTSISRIARLARIPEIRKKKRESDTRQKHRDEKNEEDRPVFMLKGNATIKKPRTTTFRPPRETRPPASVEKGIGDRLDLKV